MLCIFIKCIKYGAVFSVCFSILELVIFSPCLFFSCVSSFPSSSFLSSFSSLLLTHILAVLSPISTINQPATTTDCSVASYLIITPANGDLSAVGPHAHYRIEYRSCITLHNTSTTTDTSNIHHCLVASPRPRRRARPRTDLRISDRKTKKGTINRIRERGQTKPRQTTTTVATELGFRNLQHCPLVEDSIV